MIQIEQIYKHKEAGIFATVDTHKIFYSNGKPVSDLVFITLSTPHKLSSGGASPPASPAVVATTSPQTTQRGRVLSIEGNYHSFLMRYIYSFSVTLSGVMVNIFF